MNLLKYYVIEGIDTSGKTTQHRILKEKLGGLSLDSIKNFAVDFKGDSIKEDSINNVTKSNIIFINEPGSTTFSNNIRDMLLNQNLNVSNRVKFLLFLAQRADIFDKVFSLLNSAFIESSTDSIKKDSIKKDSIKNLTLIADRSLISGISYAFLDEKLESLLDFNLFSTQNLLPQKIVFLEISKDELQNRLKNKKLDSIEQNGIDYLLNIQNKMREVIEFICFYANKKGYISPQVLVIESKLCVESIHEKILNFFSV